MHTNHKCTSRPSHPAQGELASGRLSLQLCAAAVAQHRSGVTQSTLSSSGSSHSPGLRPQFTSHCSAVFHRANNLNLLLTGIGAVSIQMDGSVLYRCIPSDPLKLAAQNNDNHTLSPSFHGSGTQKQLSRVVWAPGPSPGCSLDVRQSQGHLKA